MENIRVRPANDADYEAVAEVFKSTMPGFFGTAESLRESDRHPMFDGPRARFVAECVGKVIGVSQYQPKMYPKKLGLTVFVLEQYRRKGCGKALYDVVAASALSHKPDSTLTEVAESDPGSIQFAECRGFREHTRVFESRFDLSKSSDEELAKYLPDSFYKKGLQIQSLTQTTVVDVKRRFYDLYFLAMKDVPNLPQSAPPSFEEFLKKYLDKDRAPEEAVLLAVFGSELVGFSQMMLREALPNMAIIAMTGCLPSFRSCGIATTLKIEAMRWAKRRGIEVISTWNDSANAPILAINQKLGFDRKPGTLIMLRDFN
ncbi:GNAT family N-acetyltransferase [Bdellovibrionota bacterium FG-2]